MARPRRTDRDQRRRSYSQNFLVDERVVARFLACADVRASDVVVEFGAGTGALTLPLAYTGARVVAVERDPVWAAKLRQRLSEADVSRHVTVVRGDLRTISLPREPFRVVANPPFRFTTALLSRLLDAPDRGPWRADLLVQLEVARKRAATPPTTLRSAGWAPWWTFEAGDRVDRRAFRPVPRVDACWLTIRRREPPVLPHWMAARFQDGVRSMWQPPT